MVLERCSGNDVVLVVSIATQLSKFLRVRKFDVNSVFLHDPLNAPSANADDPLVIRFWNVEGDFGRKLFLKECKTLENGAVTARDLDVEIVIIQCLEFYLDVAGLHDFVDLSVLLSTNKFAVLVCELDLEADLVLIDLQKEGPLA